MHLHIEDASLYFEFLDLELLAHFIVLGIVFAVLAVYFAQG
jgi:hypothetical protein